MRIQWGHMGILCLLLCTGCRKDLCYDHDQHGTSVKVDAQFSWEQEWGRLLRSQLETGVEVGVEGQLR